MNVYLMQRNRGWVMQEASRIDVGTREAVKEQRRGGEMVWIGAEG